MGHKPDRPNAHSHATNISAEAESTAEGESVE